MNFESEPLTKEGASAIRQDSACQERVIKSYRMMLRFYGFRLADEATGRVERDPSGSQRLEDHLNSSPHNWLRISRIITSLGECVLIPAACPTTVRPPGVASLRGLSVAGSILAHARDA